MRGSNKPKLSIACTKDLVQFVRECDAFQLDRGHVTGNEEGRQAGGAAEEV